MCSASVKELTEEERVLQLKAQGEVCLRRNRYPEAAELLTFALGVVRKSIEGSATSEAQDLASLLQLRAKAYEKIEDWRACHNDAKECLRLQPDNVDAMLSLALAHEGLGELDQAKGQLGWILLKDPTHQEARRALGSVESARRRRLA